MRGSTRASSTPVRGEPGQRPQRRLLGNLALSGAHGLDGARRYRPVEVVGNKLNEYALRLGKVHGWINLSDSATGETAANITS